VRYINRQFKQEIPLERSVSANILRGSLQLRQEFTQVSEGHTASFFMLTVESPPIRQYTLTSQTT